MLQPYSFQTPVKVADPLSEMEKQPWKHASTLTDSFPATFARGLVLLSLLAPRRVVFSKHAKVRT